MLTEREWELMQALPDLPDDLAEAFDSMKLAILHHRHDAWYDVSLDEVERMLTVLKDLATG